LFSGRCEEAFKFYEKHLGGKILAMMKYGGSPGEKGIPAEWHDKIMHARMTVNNSVIMASDAPPGHQAPAQGFSMSVNLDNPAEADRIFAALAEKGQVKMPIAETFWAQRFGMLTDQFGIPWMVNCEKKM
jgi:PhnB protein